MKTTTEKTFHGYSIMTDEEKGLSCETKILNEINKIINYYF